MSNIKYQFLQAIENSFKPHMDKHSIKKTEGASDKIFSYSSRKELIDTASDFSNMLKEVYKGNEKVRYIREIEISHINKYLESKKGKMTQHSIDQVVSRIAKLELVCNKKYNLNLDWHTGRVVPKVERQSIRNVAFSKEQVAMVEKFICNKKDCYGKNAVLIGMNWGLRVSEICSLKVKDINFNNMTLFVAGCGAKGGRSRTLSIDENQATMLQKIILGKGANDRLVAIRPNSANNYLRNVCKALEFKNILASKSTFHAMRKYVAQRSYKEFLEKGYTEKKAQGKVCEMLGHSSNRNDVIQHYLLGR